MDFSKFNITHSGQKWAIINRAIKLFNDERNAHALGVGFRADWALLDNLLPLVLKDKSIVWLKTFWGKALLSIDADKRDAATVNMTIAYDKYVLFSQYHRNEYIPTKNRLLRDRDIAEEECKSDNRHNPTYADFKSNGLPSKNPHANTSTNIAYLKRLEKLNALTDEQKEEVITARADTRAISHADDYWDSRGLNLDELRVTSNAPMPPDPLENYTTYVENDPATVFNVSANSIDITNINNSQTAFVYKGFPVGNFGDFSHLHQANITALSSGSFCAVYMLANIVGDYWAVRSAQGLAITAIQSSSTGRFRLENVSFGFTGDSSSLIALSTDYFFDTGRAGTAFTGDIYTDVNRTLVFDNLVVACQTTTFRYYYPVASANLGANRTISFISSNTDLQEAAAFQVAWARNSNQIIGVNQ